MMGLRRKIPVSRHRTGSKREMLCASHKMTISRRKMESKRGMGALRHTMSLFKREVLSAQGTKWGTLLSVILGAPETRKGDLSAGLGH